jgi:hypothetical protein
MLQPGDYIRVRLDASGSIRDDLLGKIGRVERLEYSLVFFYVKHVGSNRFSYYATSERHVEPWSPPNDSL